MFYFPPTVILRHRRENLKKCSLECLKNRPDIRWFIYPEEPLPKLPGYRILSFEGPPLGPKDRDHGLLLIDGTWKLAEKMAANLPPNLGWEPRSLPQDWKTAYPRRQTGCPDPNRGLASIEALYVGYLALGRNTDGILDAYPWRDAFFQLNYRS